MRSRIKILRNRGTMTKMVDLDAKFHRLKGLLLSLKKVIIAYSGGVDSTFLLKVSLDALGRENVLAVVAESETYPRSERLSALKTLKQLGAKFRLIQTSELEIPQFRNNPIERCYFCKYELFSKLIEIAKVESFYSCIDGTNADDLKDMRFGVRAARELGVRSPLAEVGFSKEEIRMYSKRLGLLTWCKPSMACLASRFPYKTQITPERLNMVEQAEEILRSLGIAQVRVRFHRKVARIEIEPKDFHIFADCKKRDYVVSSFKKIGFLYITLDLEGYRTGSLNPVGYKMEIVKNE